MNDWFMILFILPIVPLVVLINGHIALWIAEKFVDEEKGRIGAFSALIGIGFGGLKPMPAMSIFENAAIGATYILGLYLLWRLWFKRKADNG